jgi:hypothetical protein
MRALLPWWLLGFLVWLLVIAISTRISRQMTLWGIAAGALLLAWVWFHFTREPPDE